MKIEDDRTEEQRATHKYLVVGTDSFMGGWGKAKGGVSYAAWACTRETAPRVLNWVKARREMKRVRLVVESGRAYHPSARGHLHVYVVDDGHPALVA